MMIGWGVYDKGSLWVDTDCMAMKVGAETILSLTVVGGRLQPSFGEGWETEVKGEEFSKILDEANEKLAKNRPPTKGVGKGKSRAHE